MAKNATICKSQNCLTQGGLLRGRARQRVWEVDFLRGICVLLMILDHLLYAFIVLGYASTNWFTHTNSSIINAYSFAREYWDSAARHAIRLTVVCLFMFLSGISAVFSKNNKDRFVKVAAAAGIITVFTVFAEFVAGMNDVRIIFGVVHLVAAGVVLVAIIKRAGGRFAPIIFFAMAIFFFAGGISFRFWDIDNVVTPISGIESTAQLWPIVLICLTFIAVFVLRFLSRWKNDVVLIIGGVALFVAIILVLTLAMPEGAFNGAVAADVWRLFIGYNRGGGDFAGLFPYMGAIMLGAGVGMVFYRKGKSLMPKLDGKWNKGFAFFGKHAIWIYLGHILVIFALVAILFAASGYRFF